MSFLLLFLPLNDVTTTYPDVPQFKAISSQRSAVNYGYLATNFDRQKALYGAVLAPLKAQVGPTKAFEKALDLVRSEGWQIVSADPQSLRIEAICTTTLLRFKDDIVIEIRGSNSAEVHMRSKSRLGRNDFATNFKRIQNFLNTLKSQL